MMQRQELLPDNSAESVRLRKSQNTLIVVGTGILVFGVWTVVKSLAILFRDNEELLAQIRESAGSSADSVSDSLLFTALLIFMLIYLFISITARCIIGFSAIAEGRGGRRRYVYIPLTAVFIVLNFLEIVSAVGGAFARDAAETGQGDSLLISLIIELTSMIMMVQMLGAVRHVRKYQKKLEKAEE